MGFFTTAFKKNIKMYTIDLNDNPHNFEKLNLVTELSGHDTLKCTKCGIKGKTTSLSTMQVKGSYSEEKVINCVFTETELRNNNVGKRIKITFCTASGEIFSNLTPNSEHIIIRTPDNQKADSKGVWVMGVGEPVKVLNNEFVFID